MRKITLTLIAFIFLASIFKLSTSFISRVKAAEGADYVPGQLLVKFKEDISSRNADEEISRHEARIANRIDKLRVLVLKVPRSQEGRILVALARNPKVEYVEVDGLATALFTPNDPYFAANQWGLENTGQTINRVTGAVDADIDAPTAWETTYGGVRVAILDTGIDQDHPDLSSRIVLQQNFTDSSAVDDRYGHGTHVAGIVAAVTNNSLGVAGGCPDCQLMNGKVLNDKGLGAYSWVAQGITWAVDNGAKVINLSLGGSTSSRTLQSAVDYAWRNDVVVVAAAGNSGRQWKTYPAAYPNAIAVAATNNRDQKASFSTYGAKWVDVAAPGEGIFSTLPNHQSVLSASASYGFLSGTSMATPMAAAVAALIWSVPDYGTSASAVRSRLELTADKIARTGTYWSAGRVNAANAVAH